MKKTFLQVILYLIVSVLSAKAQIKVASIITDNMVLQRNSVVKIWGKASPSQKISIKTDWNKAEIQTTTNKTGEWMFTLKTTEAGGPYNIDIWSGKEKIKFQNILLGEVWLCSGQSNMEMPMMGFNDQPILGSNDALLSADNQNIRLFTVKKSPMTSPQDDCIGEWTVANATSVNKFSAVGYFYARMLQQKLKVPVGVICSSFGGSRVEAWLNKETLANFPEPLKQSSQEVREYNRPSHLYNGMIKPIVNYTIKGAIWYQGESNVNNYKDYAALLKAMVLSWRNDFGVGGFPFYYVQIAPYAYGKSNDAKTAYQRDEQLKASFAIPNSGIISTLDIGDELGIHPAEKETVSKRLAFWALTETYGFKGINYKSPVYKSMVVKDSLAIINFDNASLGLTSFRKDIDCFEIAGADKIFYPAKVKIVQKQVEVYSPQVKVPVAVRYAFQNFPKTKGYLYNLAGLPAFSFRTDDW